MSHNNDLEAPWKNPTKCDKLSPKDGPVHSWEYCIHVMKQLFGLHGEAQAMFEKLIHEDPRCNSQIHDSIVHSPQYLVLNHPMALYSTQLISNNDIIDVINNAQLWWVFMWHGGSKLHECGLNFDQIWNDFCESTMGKICLSEQAQQGGTEWLKNQDAMTVLSKMQKHLTPKDYQRALELPTTDNSPYVEFRKKVSSGSNNEPLMQLLTISSHVSQLLEIAEHYQITNDDHKRQLVSLNCKYGIKCGLNGDDYCNNKDKTHTPDKNCFCHWSVKYLMENRISNNPYYERSRINLGKAWKTRHKSSLAKQVYHFLPMLMFVVFCSKKHPLFQHLMQAANPMSKKTNEQVWLIVYCRFFKDAWKFLTQPQKIAQPQAAFPLARSFLKIDTSNTNANVSMSKDNSNDTVLQSKDNENSNDEDDAQNSDNANGNDANNAQNSDDNESKNSSQSLLQDHLAEQQRIGLESDDGKNDWSLNAGVRKYTKIEELWPTFKPFYEIDLEYQDKYYHESVFIQANSHHDHRKSKSKDNEQKENLKSSNHNVNAFYLMKHIYENCVMSQELNFGACLQSMLMLKLNAIVNKNDGMWTNIANLPMKLPKHIPKVHQICGPGENAFLIMKQYKHIEYRGNKIADGETILWLCTMGGTNSTKVAQMLNDNGNEICSDINTHLKMYITNLGYHKDELFNDFVENVKFLNGKMLNKPMLYFKSSHYDCKHLQDKMRNNKFKYPADSCMPLSKKNKLTKNAWFVTEINSLNSWELNCVQIAGNMGAIPASTGITHYLWLREHLQPQNMEKSKKRNTKIDDMFEKASDAESGMNSIISPKPKTVETIKEKPKTRSTNKRKPTSQEQERKNDEEAGIIDIAPPNPKRRKVSGKLDVNKIKDDSANDVCKKLLDTVSNKLKPQFDKQVECDKLEATIMQQVGLTQEQVHVARNLEIFWGMVNVTTSKSPLVKAFKESLTEYYGATKDGQTKK